MAGVAEPQPVETLNDLTTIDLSECLSGYLDAINGEPEPGNNRCRSYWHGYMNGTADKTGQPNASQRKLAAAILAAANQKGRNEREGQQ